MQVTKYNASGNDFIIYHDSQARDRSKLAKLLCHRQKGVGADGLVVLIPHAEYDFEWDFYNSDGSYAAMCGNATRAVAHYAIEKGISLGREAEFLTGAGLIRAEVNGTYVVTDMPTPKILRRDIEAYGHLWWLIDTGVPHLVSQRESVADFDIAQARALRDTYDANVNIYAVDSESGMQVRTYERGVEDETLACGTGVMACYVRALEEALVSRSATMVIAKSGEELYVEYTHDIYRFGGQVTKTFVAETESIQP